MLLQPTKLDAGSCEAVVNFFNQLLSYLICQISAVLNTVSLMAMCGEMSVSCVDT